MAMPASYAEEIPFVTGDIEEDSDPAIGLDTGRRQEGDPRRNHALVGGAEIVDVQEEADTAGELVADDALLLFAVRPGEQYAARSAGRTHDDPALRSPVPGGERGRILDEVEAENADEEVDGRVVLLHDKRDETEMRHQ